MSRRAAVWSLCAFALAFSLEPAGAQDLDTFPIPTPEQREQVRKGHIKFPSPEAAQPLLGPQDDFDVQHYLIDLEFVPLTRSVTGSVTMTAQSLVPNLQHVILDLYSNLTVSSVKRGTTTLERRLQGVARQSHA